ncbi:cyclic nucleotide-binding domain-containing protein [Cellvibrio polysaccharolyticus]|uniref:Cyclic nucleotide-binding domain-containing protein n=1 Tax=Cellvibrio polysaccharolyticus TaxID=2082724 RepID=A0A928V5V1_9GAMM|nr:cyclic nucleotide-binding domain-containing protein [Cellvibrio polysaccharolyticus]MBE8718428.1 cyclic nucleotide-binding domain-containing protein [Cellvibrio polysaccharolyticus]
MEIKPLQKFARDTVEHLLSAIPFFKTVRQQDAWQFELLLQSSRIVTYQPGDIVLKRGDADNWMYFLLKGRLAVYVDQLGQGELINYVTPGEVFGDLSRLVGQPRTATLVADAASKESMVFATDCSIFGELTDTRPINLQTKLAYYRNTVHNLRWKLEVYRSQHLQHALANRHRQVRLYTGAKDTPEELKALHDQAHALALLLLEWNTEFGAPIDNVPLVGEKDLT